MSIILGHPSTARAGTSCEKEQRRIRNSSSTRWISFLFLTIFQERATSRAPLRQEARSQGIACPSAQEGVQKVLLGYPRSIHTRFKFRRNMIEIGRTEDLCRQMYDLSDEDHTHHLTPQEVDNYKSNWWNRSNNIVSDTMPIWHTSNFKQALSTLRQLREEEEAQRNQQWTESSSWWSWQGSWWTPYSYESDHGGVSSTD